MKRKSIRILSCLLALIMILNAFFVASAVSIDEGYEALWTQWSRGNGPVVDDYDIDYSYYSPVENGASADKKYPLVIVMAGAGEGTYEGEELTANVLASWSAEEYQSRFTNGNSYMLIMRSPEEDWLYWDATSLIFAQKAAVDEFCANNPNVDTTKITVIGWCLGAGNAISLAATFPNYFASLIIMAPGRAITADEAEKLKDMPVWILSCTTDTYSFYGLYVKPSWDRLLKVSNVKEQLRYTTCTVAPDIEMAPGLKFIYNHNLWDYAAEDMHYTGDEYEDMKTVDGNENLIEDPYMISWVTSHVSSGETDVVEVSDFTKMQWRMEDRINAAARGAFFTIIEWILTAYYVILGI